MPNRRDQIKECDAEVQSQSGNIPQKAADEIVRNCDPSLIAGAAAALSRRED